MKIGDKVYCESCHVVTINGVSCHETGCNGFLIYKKGSNVYHRFKVWSLDVWGNRKDGYEVNDRSEIGQLLIKESSNDKEIIKRLKGKYLNKFCHYKSYSIDGDDSFLDIDYKGMPLLTLERV